MLTNRTVSTSLNIFHTRQKQTTLKREFAFTGVGIFSGKDVSFSAMPSPPDSGIVFKCDDVLIPAKLEFVEEIPNRTRLLRDGKPIQVVEHLLGAFYGLGVDNVLVEANSDELPILDASAHDYVNAILDAGIVEQDECVRELVIEKPVGIEEGNISIWLLPDNNPRITYFLDHQHPQIGTMSDSMLINRQNTKDYIGAARTFATMQEAQMLIENNIVGTDDTKLAIVVDENGPNQKLRHPFEYVHHKMLDMMGDLSLAHRHIRGHLIGIRSGHFMNRKLARLIYENLK